MLYETDKEELGEMDIVVDRMNKMGNVGVVKPPGHPHLQAEHVAHFPGDSENIVSLQYETDFPC